PSPPSQYSLAALSSSVTRPATPVSESITAAPLRDEFPVVSLRMQDKLHYPVGAVVSHLAIGKSRFRVAVMTFPTCPDNEFANPELWVGLTRRRLRRESFVVMLVRAHNDVCSLPV